MPFGLTNARSTFQELMNGVVAGMQLKLMMQALLKKRAVIQVYIGHVLLGTDDADDHLHLVEDFCALVRNANLCRKKFRIWVASQLEMVDTCEG